MTKLLVLAFLVIFSLSFPPCFASIIAGHCGQYQIIGVVEKNQNAIGYTFFVNKGTKSEFQVAIPSMLEAKIIPYISRTSKMKAKFVKKIVGYRGEVDKILSIEETVFDPLGMRGETTFKLLSKEECAK